MKFKLIYPKWRKLDRQTEFHLPPHGPVVFAAALPEDVEVDFTDENVEPINFDDSPDFVGISMMLTTLIALTTCCPWASKTRGSDAADFDFNNGDRSLSPQSVGYGLRALPVRSCK